MNRFKRPILWAALVAIILLACLSIYGAFIGAERAQVFFNSVPAVAYWLALVGLLVAGLVLFRRLLRVPALLLMHAGCILILAGGMWGSRDGQQLQARLSGHERIRKGQMPIREGMAEKRVRIDDSNDMPQLPFSVRLRDFRIEYYQPGTLMMQNRSGQTWRMPAETGRTLTLGGNLGKVKVERTFENFKMDISGTERMAYDAPGGYNPAVEVLTEKPDGTTAKRYVFVEQPGHMTPNSDLMMMYRRGVRDYISDLEVIEEGKIVKQKEIEVNHPLHYAGYHFYQHSYGQDQMGEYTVLMVVSDSGLNAVFAGYALLVLGVCWQFWFRRLLPASRLRDPQIPAAPQKGDSHGH